MRGRAVLPHLPPPHQPDPFVSVAHIACTSLPSPQIRRDNHIHCRSSLEIAEANHSCYAAIVDGRVAMKIGPGNWHPDRNKFQKAAAGKDWAVWVAN